MNLRLVHAGVIIMSAALAVVFGIWCLAVYSREHTLGSLLAAIVAFALSLGLIAYDSWFLKKTRTLR
jgi:hypothetical protein